MSRRNPPCGATVPVTVIQGRIGPYELTVAGQPGCSWEWTLMEDDEILAEGDEPTQERAMQAVEERAADAARIASGDWSDSVLGPFPFH